MSDSITNETAALPEAAEVHLRDYWLVVLRRKRIVALAFLLVFTGVALYTFLQQPIYEARTTLEVKKAQKMGVLKEMGLESEEELASEIETLRSLTMATKVARRLRLPIDEAEGLQRTFRISEIGKRSNILRISYRGPDPVQAREIVNTLTAIYVEDNVIEKSAEAGKAASFIDEQIGALQGKLSSTEKAVGEYKLESGLLTLGSEGQALIDRLAEVEQQKLDLSLRQKRLQFVITELDKAIRKGLPFSPPAIEGVPVAAEVARSLTSLHAERQSLLLDFTEAHPAVIELEEKIRRSQQSLLEAYRTAAQGLVSEGRNLEATIAGYDVQLQDIPEAELELARMTRDAKVNSELYTFLLQKQQEARIAEASTIGNVQVIDPAITPEKPVKPNKRKNLLLGIILGLMLGVGLAFFLEYLDDSVRDAAQLKAILGQPVLGLVPRLGSSKGEAAPKEALISNLSPKDPAVEAFRALRTSLKYASAKEKRQVIMVTSALPGEGKTSISSNLALVLAHEGAKVVIVGCDLRRPSLATRFGHRNNPGLSDFLVGESNVVLRKTATCGLDLISAGTIPPNPAELLSTDKMAQLIEKLRQRYDYILLDAPPALLVTDAQVLSPMTDMVITVSEACQVPAKAVRQMRETLRAVNAPVVGAILNDKTGRGTYYYGNYGYYGYGYYGQEDEAPKGIAGVAERAWKFING